MSIIFSICSTLEMEPLARDDMGPGNRAFACFVSILQALCEHVGARRCRFGNIWSGLEFEPLISDGWF